VDIVVALLVMQVYVDSGDLSGYVGVCGQWWPYWLCIYNVSTTII
jgi:hypothetical protein